MPVAGSISRISDLALREARTLGFEEALQGNVSGVDVQAGMVVQDLDLGLSTEQKVDPAKMVLENIPGNGTITLRWIVSGKGTPKITIDSAKGGVVTN